MLSSSILPSSTDAELAGIKTDDCPIEINDQNIQTWNLEDIHNFIRTIEYPRPLQMLVTDRSTYDYYTQQHIPIHRHLPNVRIMSFNTVHDQQSLTHRKPSGVKKYSPSLIKLHFSNNDQRRSWKKTSSST